MSVGHVAGDEPVAVECYRGDVQDGRRATEYVRSCPEIAEETSQTPIAADHFLYKRQTETLKMRDWKI